MTVEIISRPESRYAPTDIPQPLVDYFAGENKRLTLTSAMAMNVTQRMSEGRRVVMVDEVPPEIWKNVRYFFDRPTKWDGELHVGDCVLTAQSLENYEFFKAREEEARIFQEETDTEAEQLREKAMELMSRAGAPPQKSTWVDYHPTTSNKISDHVRGGADLAAEIAAAEAQSGKKK